MKCLFSREIPPPRFYHSFTLLELLIVIGILATLASVTFIVLNPAEQLKKTRDSRRLADLKSLDNALGIYESQVLNPAMGSSTKVYLSLPDTSSTCGSYSLPPAPVGYIYNCVTQANLRKTNGTGWVPVDFSSITIGSPLSVLPTDPKNDAAYYYTYVTGGSYQLTALSESSGSKVSDQAIADGGRMPGAYEIGSNLSLGPFTRDRGLVGYWTFDEGSGTTAYDYSGNSNTGTLTNGPTWQTSTNCKKGGCLLFDGINDRVSFVLANSSKFDIANTGEITVMFWVSPGTVQNGDWGRFLSYGDYGNRGWGMYTCQIGNNCVAFLFANNTGWSTGGNSPATLGNILQVSQWNHVALSIELNGPSSSYFNGLKVNTTTNTNMPYYSGVTSGTAGISAVGAYFGVFDDVRIYNRALSTEEIQAIYNATR